MNDVFSITWLIADRLHWRPWNLELQRLAYLAQMMQLGISDEPLFPDEFQAWDLGPIVPDLYHALKIFGSGPVARRSRLRQPDRLTEREARIIDHVVAFGREARPSQLVDLTHRADGAWARFYAPGLNGPRIPKLAIAAESRARAARVI